MMFGPSHGLQLVMHCPSLWPTLISTRLQWTLTTMGLLSQWYVRFLYRLCAFDADGLE